MAGFRVNNNKIVLKISPQEQEQSLLIVFINCIETQAKSKKNSDGPTKGEISNLEFLFVCVYVFFLFGVTKPVSILDPGFRK